jgi:hypothetical protein
MQQLYWKAVAITVAFVVIGGAISVLFGGRAVQPARMSSATATAGEIVLQCNAVIAVNSAISGPPQTTQYQIQVSFSPRSGTAGMSAIGQWGLSGGTHPATITDTQISWSEPVANGGRADIVIDRNTGHFSGFVTPPFPFRMNGTCSRGPAF